MRRMDDFDRSFRRTERMAVGFIGFSFLLTVGCIALMVWCAWEIVQLGPSGIAASLGSAVKAFNAAAH